MADLPSLKNPVSLYKSMREKLARRTGLTYLGADSATRAMMDGFISEELALRKDSREAILANQIGSAREGDLDALGGERLPRLMPTYASVTVSEENLMWYTDTTFGGINGGGSFTLGAGEIVSVPASPSGDVTIQYLLTSSCTCAAGSNIAYCSARAQSMGANQNVRANSLTVHSFTGYTDHSNNSLKVTNVYPILNGRNRELDDNYRYRLSNYFPVLAGANTDKLKLSSLKVPGVMEVRVIPGYYGVGTVAVAVFGAEGESSTPLVSEVQRRLSSIQTGGHKALAIPGVRVEFDFDVNLIVSEQPSAELRRNLTANIRRSIQSVLKDADSKSFVDFEAIRRTVISQNQALVGITTRNARNRGNLFDKVYVRRSAATSLYSSERETVTTSTYTLEQDEFATAGTINITFEVRT